MAIRSRVVRPDSVIQRMDGQQQLVVSRDAAASEVLAALDTMMLAGGHFTVSSQRAPTEFANESVCSHVLITWGSASPRTSSPQPEPHVEPQFLEPQPLTDEEIEALHDERQRDEEDDKLDTADVDDQVPTAVH